jgi:effector-binding domain-containing protein
MAYAIEIKEQQAQPTAYIRERAPPDIGMVFGKLLGEVFGYLGAHGMQPAGPPYDRIHAMDADGFDLEVGIAVASPIEGNGRVLPGELPAGRAAVTWHTGPYDQLSAAHGAIQTWIAQQGLEPAGAGWEVYHTDPGQEPDPAKLRTEIIYPLH